MISLLPEFDQVSVSVVDRAGELSTWAQIGDRVADLDGLQYALGEGPCFDSLHGADSVVVSHIQADGRWGRYVSEATELGLRSQVAMPLRCREDKPMGALNLYSTTREQVAAAAPVIAEALAAQFASSLARVREIEDLHRALTNRTVMGQATGLLMAWLEIDADQAFAYLRRVSMDKNQKLAQVAAELVHTRLLPSGPARSPGRPRRALSAGPDPCAGTADRVLQSLPSPA